MESAWNQVEFGSGTWGGCYLQGVVIMKKTMVGAVGFEPTTSCSQGRRANQAALRPDGVFGRMEKSGYLITVFPDKRNLFFNFLLTG